MLVLGIFMKLNYLCQMNVLVLKLWNCKSFIGHFYLPSMFDQFVQKVLCSLFWKIMNLWFHNTLHVVSSHSLCMKVIACQITGNLNVWMTAFSRTKASLQQQKHQSSLLFAFCRRGFFSQGACDEKCCHVTKSSYIKTQLYYTDGLRLFLSSCYVSYVAIMVNSNSKRAFWSNGSNYARYREYTIDKLLEALELILFNTYIQFNGSIFKQILGIPMGGNVSPFIADLYLSWCEYCYMTKVVKTDYTLAKLLSYNCRYLDDICTINLQNFGDIAKDIYDNTLLLEGSTCSYKQDTFLDLYIRVVDHKFITGIYHKVDDFNFEVISYPFPQSNVHSMLGYSTYYSQLIRFFRLCNNINDFLFRAKFSYSKLVKRGYKHNLLLKYFKNFCSAYNIEGKYGEKNSDLLF